MNKKLDFNEFPSWVCWLAQDADGLWWGYEVEPNMSHNGWYENEVGRSIQLRQKTGLDLEKTEAWQESVHKLK